jgi:membrane-associated protein
LGDVIEGSVNKYLYPIIALIVLISLIPLINGVLREKRQKKL